MYFDCANILQSCLQLHDSGLDYVSFNWKKESGLLAVKEKKLSESWIRNIKIPKWRNDALLVSLCLFDFSFTEIATKQRALLQIKMLQKFKIIYTPEVSNAADAKILFPLTGIIPLVVPYTIMGRTTCFTD